MLDGGIFVETLLSKALSASLGMLVDFGIKKAGEVGSLLLGAPTPRQRAFEAAWQKLTEKVDDPELRSLLEHHPFQEQVAAALRPFHETIDSRKKGIRLYEAPTTTDRSL